MPQKLVLTPDGGLQLIDDSEQAPFPLPGGDSAMRTMLQGPGSKRMGMDVPTVDATGAGTAMADAAPMLAGLANLHPALSGIKASFAVPAIVQGLRDILTGEGFDPVAAGAQGVLGAGAHGAGGLLDAIGEAGHGQTLRAIMNGRSRLATTGKQITLREMDELPQAAIDARASMSPDGMTALVKKSVDLENAALKATAAGDTRAAAELTRQMDAIDKLIPELKRTYTSSRVGAAGGTSLRGSAGTGMSLRLGMPVFSPQAKLKIGEQLAAPGGVPMDTLSPTLEGLMRILMGGEEALRPHDRRQPNPNP